MKDSNLSFKNIFKRETKLATYIIAVTTILVLGLSYALFFQVHSNSQNQVVQSGDLALKMEQWFLIMTLLLLSVMNVVFIR